MDGLLSGKVEVDVKIDDITLVKIGVLIIILLLFAAVVKRI